MTRIFLLTGRTNAISGGDSIVKQSHLKTEQSSKDVDKKKHKKQCVRCDWSVVNCQGSSRRKHNIKIRQIYMSDKTLLKSANCKNKG